MIAAPMPGIEPSTTPMVEELMTSFQFCEHVAHAAQLLAQQAVEPLVWRPHWCARSPCRSVRAWRTGRARAPRSAARPTDSSNRAESNVQRSVPVCASSPIAGEQHAEHGDDQALEHGALADGGDQRQAEDADGEQFRRADRQHERLQDRDRDARAGCAPNSPPRIDDVNDAPNARPASPRLAIG